MRLIDADALREVIMSFQYTPTSNENERCVRAVDAAPTVKIPDWISVDDRLPMLMESVLFTGKNYYGNPFLTQRGYFDGVFWHSDSNGTVYATTPVTHWMPLPEPPEEVSGDG